MSQGVDRSRIPWVTAFVGRFPLLVVHIGPSFFEESIESPGWFDTDGFPELCAREESSLEQIYLHVIGTEDLNGLAVEPIYVLHEGFVVSLDDSLVGGLSLLMSTSGCE